MGRWRTKNLMSSIAVIAIYLGAIHVVLSEPRDDLFSIWWRLVCGSLLLFTFLFRVTVPWKGIKRSHPIKEDIL